MQEENRRSKGESQDIREEVTFRTWGWRCRKSAWGLQPLSEQAKTPRKAHLVIHAVQQAGDHWEDGGAQGLHVI